MDILVVQQSHAVLFSTLEWNEEELLSMRISDHYWTQKKKDEKLDLDIVLSDPYLEGLEFEEIELPCDPYVWCLKNEVDRLIELYDWSYTNQPVPRL